MRRIRNAFVTGLLVLVPLMATIDILRWFFRVVDSGTRNYLPPLPIDFWGLGIVLAFALILVTGILTQNYVGTWVINSFDHIIRKFPLVGGIYIAIKKFMETLFNPTGKQFKQTVMVEFPRTGIYSIGFQTGIADPKVQKHISKPVINVFIPLVPNPISGFYLLVPEDKVVPLDMSVQEAFRLVVSMGMVTSDDVQSLEGVPRKKTTKRKKKTKTP